ncbi:hypothetical protein PSTG_13583, partial [Puccinia striiformis f. sp. tritici PST-78]
DVNGSGLGWKTVPEPDPKYMLGQITQMSARTGLAQVFWGQRLPGLTRDPTGRPEKTRPIYILTHARLRLSVAASDTMLNRPIQQVCQTWHQTVNSDTMWDKVYQVLGLTWCQTTLSNAALDKPTGWFF